MRSFKGILIGKLPCKDCRQHTRINSGIFPRFLIVRECFTVTEGTYGTVSLGGACMRARADLLLRAAAASNCLILSSL